MIQSNAELVDTLKAKYKVFLDESGNWQKVGFKQHLGRIFVPGYAKRHDAICAEKLFQQLEENLQIITTSPSSPGKATTTEEYRTLIQASTLFMRNVLNRHWFKPKRIKEAIKNLQKHIDIYKIHEKLNLPIDALEKNPRFVSFIIKNHLHHKISPQHQDEGCGVTYEKGMFYLNFRENNQTVKKSWHHFPLNHEGKIENMELFAHGWQWQDENSPKVLEPVKIYNVSKDKFYSSDTPRIEYRTVAPDSNSKIGLGRFGHTYIRLHEPILDEDGKPTGKVKVYAVGYNLEHIDLRDNFEDVPNRKLYRTIADISLEKLKEIKQLVEDLKEFEIKKKNNRNAKAKSERVYKLYRQGVEKTCANFTSLLFEQATGVQFNGRPFITRIICPKFMEPFYDWMWSIMPSFMDFVKRKVQLVTRGEFPKFSIGEHKRFEKIDETESIVTFRVPKEKITGNAA